MEPQLLPGVVAILINSNGSVVAAAQDFDAGFPFGYSLKEAQEQRANQKLAYEALAAMCHPDVPDSIGAHAREDILRCMMREKGYVRQHVYIGHEAEND